MDNPATELINKFQSELLTIDGLQNVPEPSWLVDGIITNGSVAVVWGDPGSAKSFITIDISMHVASGENWFGKQTRQGRVLYILGEGVSGVRKRVNAWVDYHGIRPELDDMLFLPVIPDMFEPLQVDALAQVVAEYEISLVVIDTLARAMVGRNENDNADMGKFVQATEKIRDARRAYNEQVTVLLVHHSNKSPRGLQTLRGASALKGAIDTEIELQRIDPNPDSDNTAREMICHKQKDAMPFKTLMIHLWERSGSLVPMSVMDPLRPYGEAI